MISKFAVVFLVLLTSTMSIAQASGHGDSIQFNPLIPDNIADPSVVMFNDTFYLYGTTDIDRGLQQMGPPVVWKSVDFVNWSFDGVLRVWPDIDWAKPYVFKDSKGTEKTGYFRYWAPGIVVKKDDQYILYATIVKPDEKMGTYALVGKSPQGPFHFSNGDGLFFPQPSPGVTESKPVVDDIDGDPFVDDDGSGYIFWRRRFAAALTPDLLTTRGPVLSVPTHHGGYSEGPGLFERKGIYYYFYTLSGHASYCNGYMMSRKGPLGPYDTPPGKNIFIYSNAQNNVWGPGHGNVFRLPGTDQYYFVYLEYGEGGTTRQVFANRILFNPDGTLQPVNVDRKGVGFLAGGKHDRQPIRQIAVSASSYRNEKTVEAAIAPDPDTVMAVAQSARPQQLKVKRSFSYQPANAIDQSNGTRWWARDDDTDPWIQLDLGKVKAISSLEVFFVFPAFGHAFTLETSRDGKQWSHHFTQTDQRIRSPQVVNGIGSARYLRLKITKGTAAVWECKVYEQGGAKARNSGRSRQPVAGANPRQRLSLAAE